MKRRTLTRGDEPTAPSTAPAITDDEVIAAALRILEKRIREGDCLTSPQAVRDYLRLAIGDREREVFVVVLLDAQHRVIATEELFAGTLTQTSVYPREVVKVALQWNAGSVVLAHFVACHKMAVMCPCSFCALDPERFGGERNFVERRHITTRSGQGRVSPADLDGWLSGHEGRPRPKRSGPADRVKG